MLPCSCPVNARIVVYKVGGALSLSFPEDPRKGFAIDIHDIATSSGFLEAKGFLFLLDLVSLRFRCHSVLGLDLGSFFAETFVDLVFDAVATSDRFVHEALVVALLEGSDDFFAR